MKNAHSGQSGVRNTAGYIMMLVQLLQFLLHMYEDRMGEV